VVIGGATLWLFMSDPASFGTREHKIATGEPKPLQANPQATAIANEAPAAAIVQASGVRQTAAHVLPLPAADPSGVISLTPGASYLARNLRQPGPLTLRAADGGIARLIVRDTWEVSADLLRLENVQLECHAAARLQCRGLEVARSVVQSDPAGGAPGIEWRPQDSAAVSPGTLTFADCHFLGTGLECKSRPSMIRFTNCLKTGRAALVRVPAAGRAHQSLPIHVIHMTLRESGPLVEWSPGPRAAGQRIDVVTKACVFAPAAEAPLLAIPGSLAPAGWERSIGVSGLESLLRSGSKIVGLDPPAGKPRGAIDGTALEVDGVMTASIEFFGPDAHDAASSGLKATDALFSVDNPPGIDVQKIAKRMAAR
jgi:hypothetical protein